jgi:hypothetical protein
MIEFAEENEFSALNELEATSSFLSTVLLSFLDAGIPGQEAKTSKFLSKGLVVLKQRSGNSKSDCASLSGHTATLTGGFDVKSSVHLESNEWALDENFKNWSAQVLLEVATVDADVAFALSDPDSCNRALASARSVI